MTTTKPRIQGYISQWLADQFEAECERWDLTQSQALERVLLERYSNQESVKSINAPEDRRLLYLEEKVLELLKRVSILEITNDLPSKSLEEITSDLPSELLEEVTNDLPSESLGEITSELPSELLEEVTNDLPSESLGEITSELPSELLEEVTNDLPSESLGEITSELPSELLEEVTNDLPSESLGEITSELPSELLEEVTNDLPSESLGEITSELPSELLEDYQWLTFEEAWATLPTPKPKDWDDGEQGMLKTRAKRQLREAQTGSEHWTKLAIRLFRTIGFELEPERGDRCLRKLPEPTPHVWNLYDTEGLIEGGFQRKAEAQAFCRNYEDKDSVSKWRWEYEPAQLNLTK